MENSRKEVREGRKRNKIIHCEKCSTLRRGGKHDFFRDATDNEDKYQALDNLEQLLHHYSNALVTKETADGLEVRRANKVSVGAVYVGVGNVERLRREKKERNCVNQQQWEDGFSFYYCYYKILGKSPLLHRTQVISSTVPWTHTGSKAAHWLVCLFEAPG